MTNLPTAVVVREGQRYVNIFRLSHPSRHQTVTIIPIPRYASKKFYDDWCYQPYIATHDLVLADDIFAPIHVAPVRFFVHKTPELSYFHPANMPGPVDANISRLEFNKKDVSIRSPFSRLAFRTPKYRDKNCQDVVERGMKQVVGEVYVLHPGKAQSFVMLLNPAWVDHAVKVLQGYGFVVDETKEIPVGEEESIAFLEMVGNIFNNFFLGYMMFTTILAVTQSAVLFAEKGRLIRDEERKKG
eukprot:PhF_6_TR29919/c0_g1_i1/m.43860